MTNLQKAYAYEYQREMQARASAQLTLKTKRLIRQRVDAFMAEQRRNNARLAASVQEGFAK